MTDNKDIRWKQRFQNYEKAMKLLHNGVNKTELTDLEKAGVIQVYEFTFELAWKTLRDYLTEKQVLVKFPRDVIKESFRYGIIENGEIWMDMLEKRNLMSHTYNESASEMAISLILQSYYKELNRLCQKLKDE